MELPYEILEMQAVVAHPAAYETSNITHECADKISNASKIHLAVLEAYLETEKAPSGHIRRNTNSSHDIGPMQINTVNWQVFHNSYQITPVRLRFEGCSNLLAGAKLVRDRFQTHRKTGIQSWDVFYRVAAEYHSVTYDYNLKYQGIWIRRLNNILENGFEYPDR